MTRHHARTVIDSSEDYHPKNKLELKFLNTICFHSPIQCTPGQSEFFSRVADISFVLGNVPSE